MAEQMTAAQRKEMWQQRLEQLKASGMTQKDWCRQNGIPETTLRYWSRRLKDEAPAEPGWIRLEDKEQTAETGKDITISSSGVKMIITADAYPALSRRLIRAMMEV